MSTHIKASFLSLVLAVLLASSSNRAATAQLVDAPPDAVIRPGILSDWLSHQTGGSPGGAVPMDRSTIDPSLLGDAPGDWTWQCLPAGLIWRPYLAGGREPRLAAQFVHERNHGWLADGAFGAQAGLVRYGTEDVFQPEGWQLDVEGAAFPRITLDDSLDLISADFRYGVPLTFRQGMFEGKVAFFHISSHLADEYMASHPGTGPNAYSIFGLNWGVGLRPTDDLRLYAEAAYAFYTGGPSKPWQFQFGFECSPGRATGNHGAPFFAGNARLREEVDYGGNFTIQTGWAWRGTSGRLLRVGLQYLNGKSEQAQFLNRFEEQVGVGVWYDL